MKHFSLIGLLAAAVTVASCSAADSPAPKSSVKVVPHERLLELLPVLPGWTREASPQGTTDTDENISRVQVDYSQDGGMGGLGVEIMDTAMNPNILSPLQEFIKANRTTTSGDSAMPTTTSPASVQGFPARQEWTPGVSNGTLGILVAGRFTVGITGDSIGGAEVMKTAAEAIDLKKLASLK
jgi:hypothetical protein